MVEISGMGSCAWIVLGCAGLLEYLERRRGALGTQGVRCGEMGFCIHVDWKEVLAYGYD